MEPEGNRRAPVEKFYIDSMSATVGLKEAVKTLVE